MLSEIMRVTCFLKCCIFLIIDAVPVCKAPCKSRRAAVPVQATVTLLAVILVIGMITE